MAMSTRILLLLSLSLSLLAPSASADGHHRGIPHIPPTPLILDTCQKVSYYDFCIFALTGNPLAGKADLDGLAGVSIEGAIKKAAMVEIRIHGLLNRYHPEVLQSKIRDCSRFYDDVNNQLHNAFGELQKPGGREGAIAALTAAMGDADKCEQGCLSQEYEPNLLTSRNTDFKKFCTNAIEIIKLLPGKKEL